MDTQSQILVRAMGTAVLVMGLSAWAASSWYPVPGMCGRRAAERDLQRGVYKVVRFGITAPALPYFSALLGEKYGVKVDAWPACTASESQKDYADAYDAVSEAAIRQRFGHDVVGEAWQEAVATLQTTHATR
ncbi:MAG TPA: hypothetical protein VG893_13840 [Terracidiphilus sp.]|nr:hypothetical protein [Terracidiphilus sp.]